MPAAAGSGRAEQLAILTRQKYQLFADTEFEDWIGYAYENVQWLNPWQQANLREMQHHWKHATALDCKLTEAINRAYNYATSAWAQAKLGNDFQSYAPALTAVVDLQQQVATAKAEALGCKPFDALLDANEAGTTCAIIEPLFDDLLSFLPEFCQRVQQQQQNLPPPIPLPNTVKRQQVEAAARELATHLGYCETGARIDHSEHPFSLVDVVGDSRITTRFGLSDPLATLRLCCHEVGHSLYEQQLPKAWCYQPVGRARGFSTHESQSLALDMVVFRDEGFLTFLAAFLRRHWQQQGPAWSDNNIRALVQQIKPGAIRLEADEVSYPLHIILRFQLEKSLLDGSLAVMDLPLAWNEGMTALLGVSPANDAEGCLQDIHWANGYWGYFPSYTLGAVMATQFYATARTQYPKLVECFKQGNTTLWRQWLRDKVQRHSCFMDSKELMICATGQPLSTQYYQRYLKERYLSY